MVIVAEFEMVIYESGEPAEYLQGRKTDLLFNVNDVNFLIVLKAEKLLTLKRLFLYVQHDMLMQIFKFK